MTEARSCGPPGRLYPSGPAETDGDLSGLDDDGNATAAGEAHHAIQFFRVTPDVDVVEGDFSTRVVLTGRGRVGSGVFSKNLDEVLCLCHPPSALDDKAVLPTAYRLPPTAFGYYRKDAWRRGFSPSGY